MTEEKKEARGDAAVAAADAAKAGAAAPGAANGATPAVAPPAKPNPLPTLLGIAGGALVAGAALGFFLVAPRVVAARSAAPATAHAEKKGEKGKPSKPATYRMDNIIVNPAGSNGTRFLMASVAIELDDAKIGDTLHDKDVELRDAVISTIEKQSLEAITRPGARDTLRNQLVLKLAPIIGATPRVFLPQFVLQ